MVLMPMLLPLGWFHQQPEVFSNGRLPGGWRWAGAPVLSPCTIFQNLDPAPPSQPPAGAGEVQGDTCVICRLGRWWRVKEAKNSICIIPLKGRAGAPSSVAADRAWPRELQELAH